MAKRIGKRKARTLAEQLTRGEEGGLIALAQLEPEIEHLFRHALIQETAYWSLLKGQRKAMPTVPCTSVPKSSG